MLCPKCNFKPPQHQFFIEKNDSRKANVVPTVMKTHYFNHSVSPVIALFLKETFKELNFQRFLYN